MWGGWYDDEVLMSEIADMKKLYDKALDTANPDTSAEVVFFADERGYSNLFSRSPHLQGIRDTRTAMGNTGVPYDCFMVEDAESILKSYKAAVFAFPIASECGKRALSLCDELGISYISATPEHPALTSDELSDFFVSCGVHFYTDSRDVVYVGNGFIGLHAATGGKKQINLPHVAKVIPIFGAELSEQITDQLEFELDENKTALFKLN